jgi:microcystin-dependent protein
MYSLFIGEIRPFAGSLVPAGWLRCDGSLVSSTEQAALFAVIGTTFGGDGTSFCLPDLRGRAVVGTGQGTGLSNYTMAQTGGQETVVLREAELPGHQHNLLGTMKASTAAATTRQPFDTTPARGEDMYLKPAEVPADTFAANTIQGQTDVVGEGKAHDNMQPSLAVSYIIASQGIKPQDYKADPYPQLDATLPYITQIQLVAFDFIPDMFVRCEGQVLLKASYPPAFALLGARYGGDGTTTFGIPDLRSRVPYGQRAEVGQGTKTGTETVSVSLAQLPKHSHNFTGTVQAGYLSVSDSPGFMYPAASETNQYSTEPADSDMAENAVRGTTTPTPGTGEAHENRQPFIALHYLLSLGGVYPSHG